MGTRLYVGRVSNHCRERDIERFFKGYGRLRDVMMKNGYCFVVFQHTFSCILKTSLSKFYLPNFRKTKLLVPNIV